MITSLIEGKFSEFFTELRKGGGDTSVKWGMTPHLSYVTFPSILESTLEKCRDWSQVDIECITLSDEEEIVLLLAVYCSRDSVLVSRYMNRTKRLSIASAIFLHTNLRLLPGPGPCLIINEGLERIRLNNLQSYNQQQNLTVSHHTILEFHQLSRKMTLMNYEFMAINVTSLSLSWYTYEFLECLKESLIEKSVLELVSRYAQLGGRDGSLSQSLVQLSDSSGNKDLILKCILELGVIEDVISVLKGKVSMDIGKSVCLLLLHQNTYNFKAVCTALFGVEQDSLLMMKMFYFIRRFEADLVSSRASKYAYLGYIRALQDTKESKVEFEVDFLMKLKGLESHDQAFLVAHLIQNSTFDVLKRIDVEYVEELSRVCLQGVIATLDGTKKEQFDSLNVTTTCIAKVLKMNGKLDFHELVEFSSKVFLMSIDTPEKYFKTVLFSILNLTKARFKRVDSILKTFSNLYFIINTFKFLSLFEDQFAIYTNNLLSHSSEEIHQFVSQIKPNSASIKEREKSKLKFYFRLVHLLLSKLTDSYILKEVVPIINTNLSEDACHPLVISIVKTYEGHSNWIDSFVSFYCSHILLKKEYTLFLRLIEALSSNGLSSHTKLYLDRSKLEKECIQRLIDKCGEGDLERRAVVQLLKYTSHLEWMMVQVESLLHAHKELASTLFETISTYDDVDYTRRHALVIWYLNLRKSLLNARL